jgi:hypothetical protein
MFQDMMLIGALLLVLAVVLGTIQIVANYRASRP